ncbi:MAG: M15 family metallopeptidase [Rhodobacterales bacterium]|nr:M15 family metallopeptidase [Rhodobacterales bacterium]
MVIINNITISERESPPRMTTLVETDRLFLNPTLADDWRIRREIRHRLEAATNHLPNDLCFMIYEAFRSRQRQKTLWVPVYDRLKRENPDWNDTTLYTETARWVSPPDGFGSGHQAGAAIDITLATRDRTPLDMGTTMQEFTALTPTDAPVSGKIRARRTLLTTALAQEGLINYPDEW